MQCHWIAHTQPSSQLRPATTILISRQFSVPFQARSHGVRGGAVGFGHFGTSRKFAGSIPDGVIGIRYLLNPSAALWPWRRLNLQQKSVPKIFPGGVKAAGA